MLKEPKNYFYINSLHFSTHWFLALSFTHIFPHFTKIVHYVTHQNEII